MTLPANPALHPALPAASLARAASGTSLRAQSRWRFSRALLLALVLSLLVHFGFSLWPVEMPEDPESTPLTATITQLPPPPKAVAPPPPVVKPKPKPRPRPRPAPPPPAAASAPEPAPEPAAPADTALEEALPQAPAYEEGAQAAAEAATVAAAEPEVIPGDVVQPRTLPPRVDLAYKVFYGTQGFHIGDATYRFEHSGNRYRIATVGEARGLAALILRGQGKVESRGMITPEGLQPLTLNVERGGPERRESAEFDWETGIVTLHDNKSAPLELPTYDPLTIMWQFYFQPPTSGEFSFHLATTRRVNRFTVTREGNETLEWNAGTVDTERWHRRSEDGRTDAFVWLAPSLHYLPIKLRVVNTTRGTLEALLDKIRVDEAKTP